MLLNKGINGVVTTLLRKRYIKSRKVLMSTLMICVMSFSKQLWLIIIAFQELIQEAPPVYLVINQIV